MNWKKLNFWQKKESSRLEGADKPKMVKWRTVFSAAAMLILVTVAFLASAIYIFGMDNRLVDLIKKAVPLPAVIIEYRDIITVSELEKNLQAVKLFYESQDFSEMGLRVDFSGEDGKKRLKIKEKTILNKMVEDKAVKILAESYGVSVTNKLVEQNIARKLAEFGSEENVRDNLALHYGWSLADFQEKVVKPEIYREELEKIFEKEEETVVLGKVRIEEAGGKLDEGVDFGSVAIQYSDGATAEDRGELGWFFYYQLLPQVSVVVENLDIGERSPIITSPIGFHIVELMDRKTDEEIGLELVRLRQIYVRKKSFGEWISEKMNQMSIMVPLADYKWERDTAFIEFRSKQMQRYESQLLNQSEGDPSLIFEKIQ